MTGRQEHTIQIERKAKREIENAPQLVKDYYYNFSGRTASTAEAYIRYIKEFAAFFTGVDLATLKKSDINRYMESIKYRTVNGELVENSASIRNAKLAAIKDFYRFLVDDNVIESSPAATIRPPKSAGLKTPVYMTPTEIKSVKKTIVEYKSLEKRGGFRGKDFSKRDLAIFNLGVTTGLRCTAITEIDVDDVDFENHTIKVIEKGNKARTVYLGAETMQLIKDWIKDRDNLGITIQTNALFVSARGKRLHRTNVNDLIKKYTEGLDKHITPHKMRSSCATNLYEQTGDIYLVQKVLGHSNIANTMRYAAVSDKKQKHAADVLDNLY